MSIKHGWESRRRRAGVVFATRLAENGVAESTMLALMGRMSRAMLERCSYIRMAAKVHAVSAVRLRAEQTNSEAVPVIVPVIQSQVTVQ